MSGQTRSGTAPDTVPGRPLRLSVRKRVGFSLALLALTGVLVLVLGEVSFRAWAAYGRQRAFASADYADDLWAAYDPLLGYRLNPAFEDHNAAGLPIRCPITGVLVRRMSHIYPLYRRGFERQFELLDAWVSSLAAATVFRPTGALCARQYASCDAYCPGGGPLRGRERDDRLPGVGRAPAELRSPCRGRLRAVKPVA
ncbi:MAG: hypothetical protein O3A25_12210 [Acidobacteria bacterium]|nr:hypothetical protein [Acidobacteriota bacterium]